MPEIKKYLNRDGLEEYNSLLPHSSGEMQTYVNDWLDEHPEATTTVQDGAITEPKLADESVSLRTLADDTVHMLKGAILTGNLSGEVLTTDDAYSVPFISLTIEGKSTQSGTPTPDTPIEIVNLEQVSVHASADGITDAPNWPILMQFTQALRSLPDGTHDELSFSYLRPSTRNGWAWYSRNLVQRVMHTELTESMTEELSLGVTPNSRGIYTNSITFSTTEFANMFSNCTYGNSYVVIGATSIGVSNRGAASTAAVVGLTAYASTRRIYIRTDTQYDASDIAAMFAFGPIDIDYIAAEPITTQLEPIELPVIPVPNFTIWAEPNTGLQMQYIRDSSLVIQRIEEAIADQ